MAVTPPVALTIAGSDSSGGAGVAADLKTFDAHGVWGTVAVTAVTAQDSNGVSSAHVVPPAEVAAQIVAVARDIGVDAAKTGMLATAATVEAVAEAVSFASIERLVVDPVIASSHGARLLDDGGVAALRSRLLPLATVVTPNLHEASVLVGGEVRSTDEMAAAAAALVALGAGAALVTGGHLEGDEAIDCLVVGAAAPRFLSGPRIDVAHTHGTGCVLSAALCAELARGMDVVDACVAAKRFVERAITDGLALGSGTGSVNPTKVGRDQFLEA